MAPDRFSRRGTDATREHTMKMHYMKRQLMTRYPLLPWFAGPRGRWGRGFRPITRRTRPWTLRWHEHHRRGRFRLLHRVRHGPGPRGRLALRDVPPTAEQTLSVDLTPPQPRMRFYRAVEFTHPRTWSSSHPAHSGRAADERSGPKRTGPARLGGSADSGDNQPGVLDGEV